MHDIVTEKIDVTLADDNSAVNRFLKTLQTAFGDELVNDRSFHQFPNYSATVKLSSKHQEGLELSTSIVVDISLLCEYFTIYIEDEYRLSYQPANGTEKYKTMYSVERFDTGFAEDEKLAIDKVNAAVAAIWPEKQMINYFALKTTMVEGGKPFKMEWSTETKHSLYEFMFSGFPQNEAITRYA
ncbi:hypothetical protein DXN05_10150 [Deminuibacter soli]|uniref:Uncharacterized protein n=2 Tax=Deminuibacter soli TaxID=2291815 RepID=A0A3E1NME8_9BACT|nr:hypothetical protein DXN05_10150 [Deminuibacter soli]